MVRCLPGFESCVGVHRGNIGSLPQPSINIGPSGRPASRPADEHVKLAALPLRGRIAFVRPYASSVDPLSYCAPGGAGRRSLRAVR